jgi:NADPH:quinone reductase-like Zn-dependent oxidoreductase
LLDAATLSDNFVCAFYSLFKVLGLPVPEAYPATTAPPLADEPILIYGASTSVGLYAIQLLKLAGYTNVIVTASQRNHEYLKSLGATHTIDYRSPNLASELLRVSGGRKYEFAVDIIAARTSLGALSEVLDAEAALALLLPVKSSDNLSDLKGNKVPADIEPWVAELLPGVSVRPVITMEFSQVRLPSLADSLTRIFKRFLVC